MVIWNSFVGEIVAWIVTCSAVLGGNVGTAILIVSFLLRTAMLPLTLRLARAARLRQQVMARLKPRLEQLRKRHAKDPQQYGQQMQKLLKSEGVSMFPLGGCLGALLQMPILLGLFQAVRRCAAAGGRFLWVRSIAVPDVLLAIVATVLTGAAAFFGAKVSDQFQPLFVIVPVALALVTLLYLPAGVALYWGASSLVGMVQSLLLLRRERPVR